MLGMSRYPEEYVNECRRRVDRDLKALGRLPAAARKDIEAVYKAGMDIGYLPSMPSATSSRMASREAWRMAQEHKLFSSAGFILFHMLLGTTPNMAPPSSLKKPVLIE